MITIVLANQDWTLWYILSHVIQYVSKYSLKEILMIRFTCFEFLYHKYIIDDTTDRLGMYLPLS